MGLGEGLECPRCTKKSKRTMGGVSPSKSPWLWCRQGFTWGACPEQESSAGVKVHKSLTQIQMWASFRDFELLLQTFVLQLNHTYVPRKQKRAGIQAEPKGMCSKISANINRTYLFICSSCLSWALAAIIKRNFKHSQLLISYLLILMFIFFPSFPA